MSTENAATKVHAVWDQMAPGWTRDTDRIWDDSRVVGEAMVERLAPDHGDTILELAAGTGDTGFLAARLVGKEGKVICSDFVPAMVEGARARGTAFGLDNVEYRVIDAENIDLPDDSVDGVLCRWGFMLMPNPGRALTETRRILKPGGRLSFSVWGPPDKNPWATIVGMTLVQIGRPPQMDPFGPGGVFSMSDAETVRKMVADAGFERAEVEDVGMTWRFADFDAVWTFFTEVAGAVAVLILALPEDDLGRFRQQLERSLEPFASGGGYEVPGLCLNVLAQ